MFDLNWAELLIIAVVALIVIGPEDLPDMFRQLGRFTAKLRQMSREFSRAMEQAAKDTGVKAAADDLKAATSAKSLGLDKVREAADKFEKWDPMKGAKSATLPATMPAPTMPARSLTPPPMPATPAPTALAPAALATAALAPTALATDDLAEAADDLAVQAEEKTIHGPATQALYDKQALRAQVIREQSDKLKAIEDGTYDAPATIPVSAPASAATVTAPPRKPRASKAQAGSADAVAAVEPKPRTKRKKTEQA